MAIPWFSVLQAVPWRQVIDNAPKVVEGAKKFWSAVASKPATYEGEVVDLPPEVDEGAAMRALKNRLVALEKSNADLHQQMLASSELIKTLADQNAQLVKRIEANRKRMAWLTLICLVTAVTTLAVVVFIFKQHAA
jgi:hypothetical protein